MPTVFLSYSRADHFFAELAQIKLAEADIELWRDQGQLRAGTDWRQGLERGISDSSAVLVALSENSADSSYVTFEWAYALGKGKAVVPLKLSDCSIHPRLQPIQYLDFTVPGALPWASVIDRIREIENEDTEDELRVPSAVGEAITSPAALEQTQAIEILNYLDQRGFQMVSFERLRSKINPDLSDEDFDKIIRENPTVFRRARLKGGKPGIAKLIP